MTHWTILSSPAAWPWPLGMPGIAPLAAAAVFAAEFAAFRLLSKRAARDLFAVLAPSYAAVALVYVSDLYPAPAAGFFLVVAAAFTGLRAGAVALRAPRPDDLQPPSDKGSAIEWIARTGRPGGATATAIAYELFGAVIFGAFLFRHAPRPILFLSLLPLISPGLSVILAAGLWRIDGERLVPFAYAFFLPALVVVSVAAFRHGEQAPETFALYTGLLLVFGYLILAGLAARWRAGTNYPAPMIVLAFMFAILAWEAAAAADTSLLGVAKILHRLFPTT